MTRKLLIVFVGALLLSSAAFASWNSLTTGTTQNLNSDFFIDQNTGFAAGASGTVIKTTDVGATFTAQTIAGSPTLNDVVFPSTSEGYLLSTAKLFKSTDGGASYTDVTPGTLTGAEFRKGAFNGANRAFAAYLSGTSYLYTSSNSGASFSTTAQTAGYAIYGVALITSDTWDWGALAGAYIIRKNGSTSYSGSTPIRRVFFYDANTGFAVGDSGLFLTTTDSGATWTDHTSAVSSAIGSAKNLHSVDFISGTTGWAVGDNGTVIFSKDGGASFYYYNPGTAGLDVGVNLRDINIIYTGGQAYAYIAGDSGKVYKLKSPTIAAVSPNTKKQGWVGTVEATGTDFASGIALTVGSVTTFSSTAESLTAMNGLVIISPTAATGAKDVTVTNPDLTSATSTGAFTINTNPGAVSISNIFTDGTNKYDVSRPPYSALPQTISPASPTISFEVLSSAATLSAATLNPKVLIQQSGVYINVTSIAGSAITLRGTNEANVYLALALPSALTSGSTATLELYAEDSAGNVGRKALYVLIGTSGGGATTPTTNIADAHAIFVGGRSYWDGVSNATINVRLAQGYYAPQGIKIYFFTGLGGDVAAVKEYNQPVRAMAGSTGSVNLSLSPSDFAPQYFRSGMVVGMIRDSLSGKNLGKFKFMLFSTVK